MLLLHQPSPPPYPSSFSATCDALREWNAETEQQQKPDMEISSNPGERGGSVVECRTPEREVRGSRPTAAVLCPWARHFTPRKYWLITQEAMAPSRYNWKIVDWDVKPQHNQPKSSNPGGANAPREHQQLVNPK